MVKKLWDLRGGGGGGREGGGLMCCQVLFVVRLVFSPSIDLSVLLQAKEE